MQRVAADNPLPNSGAMSAIQATANSGYKFKHWRFEDGTTNEANPYLFRTSADRTFVAVFEADSGEGETTYTKDTWDGTVLYVGTEETGIETDNRYSTDAGLTEVIIPEGRTRIASYVFSDCSNLAKITMPSTMTSIGVGTFDGCSSLTEITYNGTKSQWNNISKNMAFDGNLNDITVHCTDGDVNYQKIEFYITPENTGSITTSPEPVTATTGDIFLVVGGSMTYTAVPNSGYKFKEWTYGGLNTWTDNPVTLPRDGITQPPVMNATFEKINTSTEKKTITFLGSNGTTKVVCNGVELSNSRSNFTHEFDIGDEVTLTFTPDSGNVFASWLNDDNLKALSYDNPWTFTVDSETATNIGTTTSET